MPAAQVLLSLVVLACIGIGLTVWGAIIGAWFERRDLIAYEPRRPAPWSGAAAFAAVVMFVALPMVATLGARIAEGRSPMLRKAEVDPAELAPLLIVDGIAKLVVFGAVAAWLAAGGATRADLGFVVRPSDLLLGGAGFAALCIVIYPLQFLLQQFGRLPHPVEQVLAKGFDLATLAAMATVAVIVAPLVEEFVFRVVLQGWFERRIEPPRAGGGLEPSHAQAGELAAPPPSIGPAVDVPDPHRTRWPPIVLTSGIFAALHAQAWPSPIPLFFLSLGLGYLYQRTHRLGPSVAMHATVNGVSVLMLALAPR